MTLSNARTHCRSIIWSGTLPC